MSKDKMDYAQHNQFFKIDYLLITLSTLFNKPNNTSYINSCKLNEALLRTLLLFIAYIYTYFRL